MKPALKVGAGIALVFTIMMALYVAQLFVSPRLLNCVNFSEIGSA